MPIRITPLNGFHLYAAILYIDAAATLNNSYHVAALDSLRGGCRYYSPGELVGVVNLYFANIHNVSIGCNEVAARIYVDAIHYGA